MARQQVVTFTDDITGKRADETVSFGLDGTAYEIDLSTKNATKLREALKPFQSAARKASTALSRKGKTKGSGGNRERSAEIRAWAKSHGIEVSERGRIGGKVAAAFAAGDPSVAKAAAKKTSQAALSE
ncbi:Lsr2 family protein [Streptosporangium sp. NBC_01755]|uniref:histone-like nucleoid-structuring protein Lsr2 n=1 Tax=unclassified Streptosporangium TaxID=2632669 RepID=UPI002DDB7144|nr:MULTISPECIES: Lsr2 family protein [unclassified Streptosporangium]WSA27954.1 Lsr2 family protein [Streptosporangium sp. NBC_01810]WSD00575.1 Lsr2 family protein [Streptosporangium sp. NBC_01755]